VGLLIEHGDAEVCEKFPGGEEDPVVVVNDPRGLRPLAPSELEWGHALRCRAIEVSGSTDLARALPTWNHQPEPVQRQPAPPRASDPPWRLITGSGRKDCPDPSSRCCNAVRAPGMDPPHISPCCLDSAAVPRLTRHLPSPNDRSSAAVGCAEHPGARGATGPVDVDRRREVMQSTATGGRAELGAIGGDVGRSRAVPGRGGLPGAVPGSNGGRRSALEYRTLGCELPIRSILNRARCPRPR
jgi:hypothetical protein